LINKLYLKIHVFFSKNPGITTEMETFVHRKYPIHRILFLQVWRIFCYVNTKIAYSIG